MNYLCDSNVFIALTMEAHPHHRDAEAWLAGRAPGERLYFCRATQTSYLRLLTVREWMKEYVSTNSEAIRNYQMLRKDDRIGFFEAEPLDLERKWLEYASANRSSPKRWMDAYLAAFAVCANMRFVTFDQGFDKFPGVDAEVLGA